MKKQIAIMVSMVVCMSSLFSCGKPAEENTISEHTEKTEQPQSEVETSTEEDTELITSTASRFMLRQKETVDEYSDYTRKTKDNKLVKEVFEEGQLISDAKRTVYYSYYGD